MMDLKITYILLFAYYAAAHDGGYHPPDGNEPQCPPIPPGTYETCIDSCTQYSCLWNQLCCSNGCGHVCMDPYYPGCPNGKKLACKPPACAITKCPRQLEATCKGSCFGCIPHFFDEFGNEITKDCECRKGVQPVECFDNPCRNKKCPGHPDAVCRTNTCGTCEAIFYDKSGKEVECDVPVCEQPKKVGPCEALIPRYYYNKKSRRCEKFYYGGCQGNDNNFATLKQCQRKCGQDVCEQPKDSGPCEAAISRYYFNSDKQRCEKFIYGGCQGNDNNFETASDCLEQCGGDVCQLPSDSGPCYAANKRYYYNSESGKCEIFTYGGCKGNGNNFQTLKECQKRCDVCEQPKDAGPCFGAFPRYYFNSEAQRCEQFTYGGCKGNGNNFEKANDCIDRCGGDVCTLPADAGRCLAIIPRYFYDYETERCQIFNYGGCEGNDNNFETAKECRRKCGGNKYDPRCEAYVTPLPSGISCPKICETNSDCRSDYMCCGLYCGSQCTPKPSPCDPGEYLVKCVDLCKGLVCYNYPGAKCRVHGCDGCKAEFYDEATGRLIKDCGDGPYIPTYVD